MVLIKEIRSKYTSPHDLGEHVEEVADHPFLELVQLYCTAKPKPKSKYHQDI